MQQMFSTSNASLATSTLLAAILAYVQYKVIASTVVFAWLSLIVLLTIIRTVLVSYYLRSPVEEYSTTHARIVNYRLGVMISGCVWGSASFLMFPANDSMHQLFLVFMLAGLTAGGGGFIFSRSRQYNWIFRSNFSAAGNPLVCGG